MRVLLTCVWWWWCVLTPSDALLSSSVRRLGTHIFSVESDKNNIIDLLPKDVDTAVRLRYACKKFKRFDGIDKSESTASISNPYIVNKAIHCLDIARLSPSSFNTQPYKIILVHTPEKKLALSKCVLGPNKNRVRDSDCTAVFLADKRVCATFSRYTDFQMKTDRPPSKLQMWKNKLFITIFSSGYPLPRILAGPISFFVRMGVGVLNFFSRKFYMMPSLSSAETWSTKQVMLVAMTYILCCSSRGIATTPMEGFNAGAIRKAFKIPSRYAIPVIVSAGSPYQEKESSKFMEKADTRRYPMKEIIYSDSFGGDLHLLPEP